MCYLMTMFYNVQLLTITIIILPHASAFGNTPFITYLIGMLYTICNITLRHILD